jgi:hypothetical protein
MFLDNCFNNDWSGEIWTGGLINKKSPRQQAGGFTLAKALTAVALSD